MWPFLYDITLGGRGGGGGVPPGSIVPLKKNVEDKDPLLLAPNIERGGREGEIHNITQRLHSRSRYIKGTPSLINAVSWHA